MSRLYWEDATGERKLYHGHAAALTDDLDLASVQTVVTSPPYYALREYEVPPTTWLPDAWLGRLGEERHPAAYVAHLVYMLTLVRRRLRDDGTVWLNVADSYAGGNTGNQTNVGQRYRKGVSSQSMLRKDQIDGVLEKSALLVPQRLVVAAQDDGWIVRSDIIWVKPGGMPESAKDRPTKSYEHVFLLAKSPHYYYDGAAIAEPVSGTAHPRRKDKQPSPSQKNSPGLRNLAAYADKQTRNRRDVWVMNQDQLPDLHTNYAVMPLKLAQLCILAGSRPSDLVLDPFAGTGTTLLAAKALGRRAVGFELSEQSCQKAVQRLEAAHESIEAWTTLQASAGPRIDVDSEEWWDE